MVLTFVLLYNDVAASWNRHASGLFQDASEEIRKLNEYLQLPRTDELRKEFGLTGGSTMPGAGVSILYDVLNGWVLDPIITSANMNERAECEKHIDFLRNELPHTADSVIFTLDRGYPSQSFYFITT